MAKGEKTPDILGSLSENIAVADLSELMEVWNVFYDIMGGNIKGDKKKAAAKKTIKK